jgi:hypothetical protein
MDTQVCSKCDKELNVSLFDRERKSNGEITYRKQCSKCRLEQKHERLRIKKKQLHPKQ